VEDGGGLLRVGHDSSLPRHPDVDQFDVIGRERQRRARHFHEIAHPIAPS
jgi:hypothetical protein